LSIGGRFDIGGFAGESGRDDSARMLMTSTFTIKPDHPALPGHFPGHPVVPGVVVIDHLILALGEAHPERTCTGVRRMKFLRQLLPGEPVAVLFGEAKADSITVKAHVAGEPLVDGRLMLAPDQSGHL
jgi:3-hydroxyacyl-[acyl-carrier-protein] dehydratase